MFRISGVMASRVCLILTLKSTGSPDRNTGKQNAIEEIPRGTSAHLQSVPYSPPVCNETLEDLGHERVFNSNPALFVRCMQGDRAA